MNQDSIDHCQYCHVHYNNCDCCKNCLALKGTCDCKEDGPTILSPADGYRCLYSNPKMLENLFGITKISEVDAIVMRTYKEEFWPARLRGMK